MTQNLKLWMPKDIRRTTNALASSDFLEAKILFILFEEDGAIDPQYQNTNGRAILEAKSDMSFPKRTSISSTT